MPAHLKLNALNWKQERCFGTISISIFFITWIYFVSLGQSDHPRSSLTESYKWAEWSSGATGWETARTRRGTSEIRSGHARQANACGWRRGVQEKDGQRHRADRWLGRRKNKVDWTEQEIWSADSKVWFVTLLTVHYQTYLHCTALHCTTY